MLDFNDAAPVLKILDAEEYERQLETLRAALQAQATDLIRDIFPRARIQGSEARIGSTDGEPGESLSIGLAGDRAGLWFDHATGEGGDLIDLWIATQGYGQSDFPKAVADLERWAGLSTAPRFTSAVKKVADKRKAEADKAPAQASAALGPPVASWHYLSPDGVVLAIVRRYDLDETDPITGKRKKTFRPFKADGTAGMPNPRPLYRLPEIRSAETVVFVEGEKCADALASVGVEATCIMGGSNALLEKSDLSPLAGKKILLWPDNDGEGKSAATSHVGQKFMARLKSALEEIGCSVADIPIPAGKPPKWDAADAVTEGDDIGAIIAASAPAPVNTLKVPIYTRAQLRARKRPESLIYGVLYERTSVALYGPSGALKSFIAIDMAMCVATGVQWQGRDVKQGPVVYVTGEGQDQISARLDAWDIAHGLSDNQAPIFVVPFGVSVSDPAWLAHLVTAIESVCPEGPTLIWLDTLARTFGQGDENSQKDMNAYISGMDFLRARFGCAAGVVHHTGKDADRGLRGSSNLYAAMDTVIRADRKANSPVVTLKNQQPHGKQKDASEFEDIPLQMRVIELPDVDEKGAPITSLALIESDPEVDDDGRAGPEKRDAKPRGEHARGAVQKAALDALRGAKGEPMGITRIALMIKKPNGTALDALASLVEKGLVSASGDEGERRWWLT